MKKKMKDIVLSAEMFLFSLILYAVISKLVLGDLYLDYISISSGHWLPALLCSWWFVGAFSLTAKMTPEAKELFRNDVAMRIKSLITVPVAIFNKNNAVAL